MSTLGAATTRADLGFALRSLQFDATAASLKPGQTPEEAFWPLDDVVCALAPDGDPAMYERWQQLYDLCKAADATFIPRRDKIRGLS